MEKIFPGIGSISVNSEPVLGLALNYYMLNMVDKITSVSIRKVKESILIPLEIDEILM